MFMKLANAIGHWYKKPAERRFLNKSRLDDLVLFNQNNLFLLHADTLYRLQFVYISKQHNWFRSIKKKEEIEVPDCRIVVLRNHCPQHRPHPAYDCTVLALTNKPCFKIIQVKHQHYIQSQRCFSNIRWYHNFPLSFGSWSKNEVL